MRFPWRVLRLAEMAPGSRIFVAGHNGLVGGAITRNLRAAGYDNLIERSRAELDLTRQVEVEAFFESERPEFVFLAAAKVGGIHANNTRRAEFIYQNMMIAANVVEAARRSGVKKLCFSALPVSIREWHPSRLLNRRY